MTSWHAETIEATLDHWDVDPDQGLSDAQAADRLREHGPNQLKAAESRPWWSILVEQLRSIVVYLLAGAAILAFATARWPEGIAVSAVIAVNTAIGFVSEWKAVRSMSALREMGEHSTTVRREGSDQQIDAPQLVPGDIVIVEAGDLIPADLRVVSADRLRVNEAPLTGESVPVNKTADAVEEDAQLADRVDLLFKGTTVADGSAVGVTVATGVDTELGRISELADSAEASATPLQRRLDQLGRRLALLTMAIAVLVAAIGVLVRQQDTTLVIETSLALGIAAIPEGLPIVATIALARGMYRMAKRNALINRLTAVETLGATRVILTDKTGTLTENRMTLRAVETPMGAFTFDDDGADSEADEATKHLLTVGVLCNSARLATGEDDDAVGDPTEVALLSAGATLGIDRSDVLEHRLQTRIEDFDPRVKMMATFHEEDSGVLVAVKGAPAEVLKACSAIRGADADNGSEDLDEDKRQEWASRAEALAGEGLRILAMADKQADSDDVSPYEGLRFLGLVGLLDPPRDGVKDAIDKCQSAGIRVEMVTGDQAPTALAIAHAVGIVGDEGDPEAAVMLGKDLEADRDVDHARVLEVNVFSRVSPEQKLTLVQRYQDNGEIVAMTGDGVNDAPALKKADIGVAMGMRGTEAAKQAADMVLLDDAFNSIVAAVEHGRVVFGNIRKSVIFMLTTNVAEVLAVTAATVAGWPLPLLPLQILYLNVVTDVFPALALGVGPGSGQEMKQPPRDPQESVLNRRNWREIIGFAAVVAASVLAGLLLAQHWLGMSATEAVTVSFLTLAFSKLWFTFALRSPGSKVLRNEITRNPWVWGAIALCIVLLVAAVYVPVLSDVLQTHMLSGEAWGLVLIMSLIPLVAGQAVRQLQRRAGVQ
ncbi:cation-transporting P-type ATPase [Demequina sp. TTPB684]|uniref:cation-translocating P-type ATPase n=1 Tax=unclassified Demequina TaxID=2620311 RepID=UPI001CF0F900|nr:MULTISPECIES: cation-transporting P-type ATPase [unclassified Demequina]MCB2414012.1 cation-transporting P-type ATPase [Demequina sp. TTPB684]UPU89107.1 cation-transporting P-type ATPase [Demequina sp. TMPB413]